VRFVSSTYDQENRLTKWEKGTKRSEWNYNGLGLQRELREYENGSLIKTERYVYDGTQIVAILNAANTTVKTFTRGLDLSGSMEGAGGIGGLLGMKDGANTAYYFADGNGNVAALYSEQGESRAVYQYDGFGNKVASNGSMSESNPFQWSSKYFHQPSGLVAYEFRFYSSTLGRWINRDPIEEAGGINLYGFVGNQPTRLIDLFGLQLNFLGLPPAPLPPPGLQFPNFPEGPSTEPPISVPDLPLIPRPEPEPDQSITWKGLYKAKLRNSGSRLTIGNTIYCFYDVYELIQEIKAKAPYNPRADFDRQESPPNGDSVECYKCKNEIKLTVERFGSGLQKRGNMYFSADSLFFTDFSGTVLEPK
jgi:RHS repeat-associated protein